MSQPQQRYALGRRFEALTEESFTVLRWAFIVGFARFLSVTTGAFWAVAIHWTLSALLLGYLASRFLLRPEIPLFGATDRRWKRIVQTAANILICVVAFACVMWGLNMLADGVAQYRFAPMPG
ncbi:MAG: hypothetical protein ACQEVT_09280 [Pseudomonadota bacterium]|uniref:hypothetical protein n=1 Tax=Roseovarius TaxID=74030 RepID=UPI0022A8995A|nr:hypothetical protein [Roseovarius sp. EGI FJ00037]MCZ0812933.1 hypothetical protein [Roseovarius sp. EGI FJ00037]